MNGIQIVISETPERCRWCGCSHYEPCAGGCGWANARHTLCTACVDLDRDVRTVRGRRRIAQTLQDAALETPMRQTTAGRRRR